MLDKMPGRAAAYWVRCTVSHKEHNYSAGSQVWRVVVVREDPPNLGIAVAPADGRRALIDFVTK